ncbi:FAD-binding protein [Streptomyces sp. CS149]|uniref:FAD/NAD(P)-binding protein n=1 Tax=Streptomyces sp. CS149 TaxID=2109332 RepID=UPI000D1C13D9|nr:FAD/NAD(P)-binding protein [Streptomyces sp. CS149]MCC8477803.1 FAD/NAD(P)-binding protein [Streptomyces globisporus]PSK69242.1 FAD-binding protein [Streptomyces sp. CS149]
MTGASEIAVVGAGPRGLSVLERICANERRSAGPRPVVIHLVDPYPPGAGRVWRTDQSRLLLMNTVASQVTVYTDASVEMDGPVEPGPSLYAWAHTAGVAAGDRRTRAEARALTPDSYPTRALYGRYLRDVFERVRATAPAHCTVVEHRTRAVALTDDGPLPGGPQTLVLADGTRLTGLDAVVLSLGHLPGRPSPEDAAWSRTALAHGLSHYPPANPADLDLSEVKPGLPVLIRGLGLNFFDHMALLTRGRGGSFVRRGGRLVYLPSGQEPKVYAGSRRGLPYHARGENQKGAFGRYEPRLLDPGTVEALRRRVAEGERVHFAADLWPLIAKEVECVYYETLLVSRGRAEQAPGFAAGYLTASAATAARLLDAHGIEDAARWDWDALARPSGSRRFPDRAAWRQWLLGRLEQDMREARAGNVRGPLKAALDVLRDLRNEIRLAVDHGGLEGNSYRDELQGWYTPLNAYLSIGPPLSRIEELHALIEAGVVEILGPGLRIDIDLHGGRAAFVARSPAVDAEPVSASVLIEARLPEPHLRRTGDALLAQLMTTHQVTPYRLEGSCGTTYESGGLAVTERPYRTVDAYGRVHPRRFAYGVPTETVHWVTAAGIRPGVNSVTLGDSDAIARAVLALAPAGPVSHDAAPGNGLVEMAT